MRPFSLRSCNMRNSTRINRYSLEAHFYAHGTFSRGGEISDFSSFISLFASTLPIPGYTVIVFVVVTQYVYT